MATTVGDLALAGQVVMPQLEGVVKEGGEFVHVSREGLQQLTSQAMLTPVDMAGLGIALPPNGGVSIQSLNQLRAIPVEWDGLWIFHFKQRKNLVGY